MAAGARQIRIEVIGDATSAQRALGQVEGSSRTLGQKLSGMLKSAAILGGATALVAFGKSSVAAFKEAEEAQNRLSAAFAKSPQLVGANIDAFRKLNEELAKKTRFDDDATASGQAVLAGFNLTAEQLRQLTPLLQDYAARTGKDLPTAATDLGKALLGQGRALKSIGIEFTDTGSTAGNFAQLVEGLNTKVGGFAEKEGKTAAGQAEILRNQFGELQEKVGSFLIPALTGLANILLQVIGFFQGLNPNVQLAIGLVGGLLLAVFAITKAVQAWTAVQAALNVVMALNPIVLVGIAIAALVAGVIIAYQKFEGFRNVVQTVWEVLKRLGEIVFWAWSNFTPLGLLLTNLPAVFGAVSKAIESVIGWIKTLVGWVEKAIGWLGKLADLANKVEVGGIGKGLPQGIGGPTRPTGRQHGGVAQGWTLVGERGPELMHVGSPSAVLPNNRLGAGATYITINMPPGSDGEDVVAALKKYERRNGPVPITTRSA